MNAPAIAIIGGGPGGLMTAYLLQKRSTIPLAMTIYEATDRFGGKIRTGSFDSGNASYEIGAAEFYDYSALGPDPLRELIVELGLPTRPLHGGTVFLDDVRIGSPDALAAVYGESAQVELNRFRRRARRAISPAEYYESDWVVDNADPLSHRSFRSILETIQDDQARRYVEVAVHSDLATEPHRTTAMYGLQNWLMNEPEYMQLYAIDGGNQRLVDELIRRVNVRRRTGQRVTRVRPLAGDRLEVTARGPEGERIEAFDFVAVALPDAGLSRIDWDHPSLARSMRRHHDHHDRPAHYLRVAAMYSEPFWRGRMAESYFHVDAFGGTCIYDESDRLASGRVGVLNWLIGGEAAASLANDSDTHVAAAALATFPAELGEGRPLETRVHRWIGAVSAMPGGRPVWDVERRHRPEPDAAPRLHTVGDYLFDSTINGVLDSAEWVAESILEIIVDEPRWTLGPDTAAQENPRP